MRNSNKEPFPKAGDVFLLGIMFEIILLKLFFGEQKEYDQNFYSSLSQFEENDEYKLQKQINLIR